jgi:NAD(P)-dependent dehydrogenase (short-subunit alcohol dehydrogenase family)
VEDLLGRVIVVTGAGTGIGAATCQVVAQAGATMVAADIDLDGARATAAAAEAAGSPASAVGLDVADIDAIDTVIGAIGAEHGRIDVLVNNAGVSRQADLLDVTGEDWNRIFSVKARGLFFCLQRTARVMIEQGGGRIVNMSSISARGYPRVSNIAYAASKGAVIALTRVAAQQLGPHRINVNAVCPGLTLTPLVKALMQSRAGRPRDEL